MCAEKGVATLTDTKRRVITCTRCGNKIGEVINGEFVSYHAGRTIRGGTSVTCEGWDKSRKCGHVNNLPAQWGRKEGKG